MPSWSVRWARRAGTRDFYPALAPLVSLVQNIFFLIHCFNVYVPSNPSLWAGSRAGPPVFECVFPVNTQRMPYFLPVWFSLQSAFKCLRNIEKLLYNVLCSQKQIKSCGSVYENILHILLI
jgi:hypothetical protein